MKNSTKKLRKLLLVIGVAFFINNLVQAQTAVYFAGSGAGTGNTGSYCTGVGVNALHSSNSGVNNVGFGTNALFWNTSGNNNTAIGTAALGGNTTGIYNVAIGTSALSVSTTASRNTAVGYNALKINTSGTWNVALGSEALSKNTTGTDNTGIGVNALWNNVGGIQNTAVGSGALYYNINGNDNSAFGFHALVNTYNGSNNNAFGKNALYTNIYGSNNNAFGWSCLFSNKTGEENSAFGHDALFSNDSGSFNSAFGNYALLSNTKGNNNCSFGSNSLNNNTTGNNNVALGYNAALNKAVYNKCTFVGATADASANNFSNATAIGYGASVNGSNKVRVGNTAVTSIGGQVGWTTSSDRRLKTNITESKLGLDFIMKLNPVTYNYIEEGQKDILYTGLIAQEVDEAAKREGIDFSGVDRNGEYWGIRYGDLTVPLIKAVQDMNQKLEKENEELKMRLEKLESASLSGMDNSQNKLSSSHNLENKLEQNSPNPFSDKTTIRYSVSADAISAHVIIRNLNGVELKSILLDRKENGSVTIESSQLAQGTYTYTLEVDGKSVDTKLMVITK